MTRYDDGPMSYFTEPIVKNWFGLIENARRAKQPFVDNAEMCKAFYEKSSGFMWDDAFRKRYLGSAVRRPKFQVTVNTAFEYVSLFAPRLYWQSPKRGTSRPDRPQFDLEGLTGGDPQRMMYFQQLAQSQMADEVVTQTRDSLWESYLNDTPSQQPYGTLEQHTLQNINEALVTGRGLLVPRAYSQGMNGGSGTGSYFTSNVNLLVDPDCVHPLWMDAKWIALRHVDPYWEVERKFGWPEGSLRDRGHFLTGQAGPLNRSNGTTAQRPTSETSKDLIEWYEIWSRCGVGSRWSKTQSAMSSQWDMISGDYSYLCVANTIKCPLNIPSQWLSTPDATVDNLRARLAWPIPYWKADKWPVSPLDFCTSFLNGAWPVAPLAAAMGEMICLQILLSYYLQNAEANSQQILVYFESMASRIEEDLQKNQTPVTIRLQDSMQQPITNLISFLNRPNQNTDCLEAMRFLMEQIERKTGLSSLLYGQAPSTQPRSAEQSQNLQNNVTTRPDFMAKQVAEQQADIANKERICAFYTVVGQDVALRLGPLSAALWDELVLTEDEDSVLRGMTCIVKASDLRKPDKEKEAGNLNTFAGYILPILQQYAAQSGDYTGVNAFIRQWGDATEMDTSGLQLGNLPPPPPEGQPTEDEQAAGQQQLQQADEKHALAMAGHEQQLRQRAEMHKVKMQQARKPSTNGAKT